MDIKEKVCDYCRKKGSSLNRCTRCWDVQYCSKQCQTLDWLGHKSVCGRQSRHGKKLTEKPMTTLNEVPHRTNKHSRTESVSLNVSDADDGHIDGNKGNSKESDSLPENKTYKSKLEAKMKSDYIFAYKTTNSENKNNQAEPRRKSESVAYSHDAGEGQDQSNNSDKDLTEVNQRPDSETANTSDPKTRLCKCCGLPGPRRCSRCKEVFYCSAECQRKDWSTHKLSCTKDAGDEKERDRPLISNKDLTKPRSTRDSGAADTSDSKTRLCKCCGLPGPRRCSRCKEAFYCSAECQRKDWSTHKLSCTKDAWDGKEKDRPVITYKDLTKSRSTRDSGAADTSDSKIRLCKCCGLPGPRRCSRCKEAFYCSAECQRKDWSTHKISCTKQLTEEEIKIKKTLEEREKWNEDQRRSLEQHNTSNVFSWITRNFQGSPERFFEMLTLEQALHRATRPEGSLHKAVLLANVFFPLVDIVTEFSDIPWEPMFPHLPFMFPRMRGYVLVAFMYRYHEHVMRHGVYLKDARDEESKVEFYLDHVGDNPFPFFRYSQVKPGGYICLVDPVMHIFGDGSVGIRINNPGEVKVLDIEMFMK